MTYNLMESIVRGRLREKRGQVYCPDCLAKDLPQNPQTVKEAMKTAEGGDHMRGSATLFAPLILIVSVLAGCAHYPPR